MAPTVGRIVQYQVPEGGTPYVDFQSNGVKPGDYLPAIVVRVWNPPDSEYADVVNLKVFTDCGPVLNATSVHEGTAPGTWRYPPRV